MGKQTMGGNRKPPQKRGPRECLDSFRATAMEEEDPKTEGRTKVTTKQVAERTWYTPEAWEHGGLRIKNEGRGGHGCGRRQVIYRDLELNFLFICFWISKK